MPATLPHGTTGFKPKGLQSYGMFVSNGLKAFVPGSGEACRGNAG